jgi:hypothetical protein
MVLGLHTSALCVGAIWKGIVCVDRPAGKKAQTECVRRFGFPACFRPDDNTYLL